MIKKKETIRNRGIEIDLTGPDGNAFSLINVAQTLAKQFHYDGTQRGELTTELMAGDYENLLEVFDKHFGKVVTLYR
jgi:hypothetical protein